MLLWVRGIVVVALVTSGVYGSSRSGRKHQQFSSPAASDDVLFTTGAAPSPAFGLDVMSTQSVAVQFVLTPEQNGSVPAVLDLWLMANAAGATVTARILAGGAQAPASPAVVVAETRAFNVSASSWTPVEQTVSFPSGTAGLSAGPQYWVALYSADAVRENAVWVVGHQLALVSMTGLDGNWQPADRHMGAPGLTLRGTSPAAALSAPHPGVPSVPLWTPPGLPMVTMPMTGLGSCFGFSPPGNTTTVHTAVLNWLRSGGRAIHTAWMYCNERAVGQAIQDSQVPRKEIFVMSMLPQWHMGYNETKASVASSLANLGLDYIDLYMFHWPGCAPLPPFPPLSTEFLSTGR
jgi:hypothetical protein